MFRSTFTFPLICASFWYFDYNVIKSSAENALLYSLAKITKTLDETETPCFTACPATGKTQKKLNDEVSISGKSLFLREIYQIHDLPSDIQQDICDEPFQPAIIYNSKRQKYHIGYELYYDENTGGLEIHSVYENFYDRFRSVNVSSYDKITHSSKPQNNFFLKYIDDGTSTKFKMADGCTLIFFWIPVFIVDYSMYKKRLTLSYNAHINDELKHDLNSTCDIFKLEDEDMNGFFTEKNQENSLKNLFVQTPKKPSTPAPATSTSKAAPIEDILEDLLGSTDASVLTETRSGSSSQSTLASTTSTTLPPTPPPILCGQAYGCFEKSQVIPLWYFRSRSTRLASCTFMNIIPVWKTIADGQLKKVDRNIVEMLNKWRQALRFGQDRTFGQIIYGTWSWLKLPTKTDPKTPQPVFLSDPKLNQTIPVPKIIYRIVSVWWRGVAIIVHNDLSPIPQIDRLCKNESHGWQIINEDWTTGLTYTCPLTQDLDRKLGGNVFNANQYFSVLRGTPEHSKNLLGDYHKLNDKKPKK